MRLTCLLLIILLACQTTPQKVIIPEQPPAQPAEKTGVIFFTGNLQEVLRVSVNHEQKGWFNTTITDETSLSDEIMAQLLAPTGPYTKIKIQKKDSNESTISIPFELERNSIISLNPNNESQLEIEISKSEEVIVTSDRKIKTKNKEVQLTKVVNLNEKPKTNLTRPKSVIEQPILEKEYPITIFRRSMTPNTIKTNTRTRLTLNIKNLENEFWLTIPTLNIANRIYSHKENKITFTPETTGEHDIICDCQGENKIIGTIKVFDA